MIEEKHIKQAGNIFATDLEGELVILNQNDGKYYTLNQTGKLIWEFTKDETSFNDLVEKLSKIFHTTPIDEIRRDTLDTLRSLSDKNLLEVY